MSATHSLIIHGGAWDIPREAHQAHIDGVRQAAKLGQKLLQAGRPALDVVEQVIRLMEDDPTFDAGRGSHLNHLGHIELDALIMDGKTLDNGAVAAVQCIANPISLARLVMTETDHALLVGMGAQDFAAKMGIPRASEEDLLVGRELERWEQFQKNPPPRIRPDQPPHGTVGAVARDQDGNIAAGTSTGGTLHKMAGRVGDSPLIGSGGYADNNLGGASATGWGESLMKIVMCKTVCDLMGSGLNATIAAKQAVQRLNDDRVQGLGGVIVIDPQGRVGFDYNTPFMARAYIDNNEAIIAEI